MNWEARKTKAAERKRQLAARLDSNELLISGIRFYLAVLLPTRAADALPVRQRCKDLSPQWKTHLKADRRILGIEYNDTEDTLRMPANYWRRLAIVGIDIAPGFLSDKEFLRLNTNLELDSELTTYAVLHPQILDGARRFLCGGDWPPTPEPPQLDPHDEHVQNRVKSFLHDLRSRW